MNALSEDARQALLGSLLADRHCASLRLDPAGRIVELAGELAWFGLDGIGLGDRPGDALELFHDVPPPEPGQRIVLPRMELAPGRSSEVHCLGQDDGTLLLFLDATLQAKRERHFQQRGNELALVMRSWGSEIFEEKDGEFSSLGAKPAWLRALTHGSSEFADLVAASPFLENFLVDAQAAWDSPGRIFARSGMWTESDGEGREWHLKASAGSIEDGRRMLWIQSVPSDHHLRSEILQAARGSELDLSRLRREIDKKEVLLHCIIHDLLSPLGSIVGSMSLAQKGQLDVEKTQAMLSLGLAQARRQETLIRGILDAFSAEVRALEHFEVDPGRAPQLPEVVREALTNCQASFDTMGVAARFESTLGDGPLPVVADEARLLRVLANLLENALRHSPKGGTVTVRLAEPEEFAGDAVELSVEDEGPGVPAEEVDHLFTKFAQGDSGGAAGLGLYFCRSTVKIWGGGIGYRARPGGGACFWVRLLSAG